MSETLYDKLMSAHIVREQDGAYLIYIDRQLIYEVTSPQAFEGLSISGRKVWRNKSNLAVPDHNVPTTERSSGNKAVSLTQSLDYKLKHLIKIVKLLIIKK